MRTRLCLAVVVAALCCAPVSLQAAFERVESQPEQKQDQFSLRRWRLAIRALFGYGDNINMVSHRDPFFDGETKSFYGGLQANAGYLLFYSRGFSVDVSVFGEATWYTNDQNSPDPEANDDAKEYNLHILNPAIEMRQRFKLAGRRASAGMKYEYRRERGPIESIGLKSHTLTWDLQWDFCPTYNLSGFASYAIAWDDFRVKFAEPELSDRDAFRQVFTIGGKWRFDRGRRQLKLFYQFTDNDAESQVWDYFSNGLGTELDSHLWGPLYFTLGFLYQHHEYAGAQVSFLPTPARDEMDVFTYSARLRWLINRNWSADIYYVYVDYHSNNALFEGSSNNVGVGITWTP